MIQNMLLKEKENLGFYINQFTEAIFISSLQIIIFLPESMFILPYFLKDICMEYVTPVARFVFSLMSPFCFVSVCALLLNWKLTALQHKLFFTVRITEFCGWQIATNSWQRVFWGKQRRECWKNMKKDKSRDEKEANKCQNTG